MDRLLKALKTNFEGDGNEEIRRMCLAAPKYGNDDDYVDEIFNEFDLWSQRRIVEEKHVLGHRMRSGRGGATTHAYLGKTVGALPDGRKAWEALADGSLSPMRGVDVKGPTAVINSASKVNHTEQASYSLFNMKLTPGILKSRDGVRKFISLIKTYFDRGGYHVQFNLMGQEALCEAQKHPEQHRDLLVRVAGYSAYFVELSREVQDDIIGRREHTL
jgi:pyruvate-formate lyase